MFFVHEIHAVAGGSGEALDAALREQWAPAVAREPGARVAWCVRSFPGVVSLPPELITLTAVADGVALERFAARVRGGDLRDDAAALDALRTKVTTRIMAPMSFSPLTIDLDAIPTAPVAAAAPNEMYIHDLVPPVRGMQRKYEIAMRAVLMKMQEREGLEIQTWAGLETVAGGGPDPESLMVSHIQTAAAGAHLLAAEIPKSEVQPGKWLFDALKVRDTWKSRLVRTVSWSPVR